MKVANSEWRIRIVFKCAQLPRILHEKSLGNVGKRTRQEIEKAAHDSVISAHARSRKARHVVTTDRPCRYCSKRRLAADGPRNRRRDGTRTTHLICQRVPSADFTAGLESVLAFRPAQVVA